MKGELKKLIKSIKEKTGKTQQDIAVDMGYKKNYISEILSPKGEVSDKFLSALKLRFSDVLGIGYIQGTIKGESTAKGTIKGATTKMDNPNPYLKLLEDNDRFFKTEYHNLLISLNKIIEIGLRSEELIKLNLEHVGNVEAHLKEVAPDVVHEQINNQIAGVEVSDQKGIYAGK